MAELSADEAARLARGFLTGKASADEQARLQAALQEDTQLALELLSQIQGALDDVAPAGLTRDQWAVVDSRVQALIQPRMKSGGLFGWLFRIFRSKPKPAPEAASTKVKRRGSGAPAAPEAPAPAPAPAQAPASGLDETLPGGEGMEEMAPIAAAPAPAPAAAAPARRAQIETAELTAAVQGGKGKASKAALIVLLLLALGGGGWVLRARLAQWTSAAVGSLMARFRKPAPVPTPVAVQPTPTPIGPPKRGVPPAGPSEETLPAALPEATPRPAGAWDEPQGGGVYAQPTIAAPIRR